MGEIVCVRDADLTGGLLGFECDASGTWFEIQGGFTQQQTMTSQVHKKQKLPSVAEPYCAAQLH